MIQFMDLAFRREVSYLSLNGHINVDIWSCQALQAVSNKRGFPTEI